MSQKWFALDGLNTPHGPFTRLEILQLCLTHGDLHVLACGENEWRRASSVFSTPEPMDRTMQPSSRAARERCADRDIQELLGIVKGVIADGYVSDAEIVALQEWVETHKASRNIWPVDVLAMRLQAVLEDGYVDADERTDLTKLMRQVVGEKPDGSTLMDGASRLPLDEPAPGVEFRDRHFVLTGQFAFGTRDRCETVVEQKGGIPKKGVTKTTDYLVIGTRASAQWALSSYGRKIQKAVDYRDRMGCPLKIVSEEHWVKALRPWRNGALSR